MTFIVTVKGVSNHREVAIEFEAGSAGEALAIIQAEGTAFGDLLNTANPGNDEAAGGDVITTGRRKRRTKAEMEADAKAAAAAAAPPPAPVAPPAPLNPVPAPAAAVPPPPAPPPAAPAPQNGNPAFEGPDFLNRNGPTAAPPPAPVAPPPAPPAPPAAPAASQLRDKVIADLQGRADKAPDKGAGLAEWLANAGIVAKGCTFSEAVSVLRLEQESKIAPIANALGVAA